MFVTDNQSSIRLPAEAFTASKDPRVITVVYLTLNDVLTLNKENNEDSDLAPPANTTVVSSTVDPRPPAVFNNPVKIVLQNRGVLKLCLIFRNSGSFLFFLLVIDTRQNLCFERK